jgi:hypothetical protein
MPQKYLFGTAKTVASPIFQNLVAITSPGLGLLLLRNVNSVEEGNLKAKIEFSIPGSIRVSHHFLLQATQMANSL